MTNINDLTDDELARAADLYMERVFTKLRQLNSTAWVHLETQLATFGNDAEVKHILRFENKQKHVFECGNMFDAVKEIIERESRDAVAKPRVVAIALPAPVVEEKQYAEFTEVNDDVSF